ncbi:MAG TPA: thiamine pyrophosphate-binding protein [Symbiobacteriaceae bacterium]|nr:thiamine pyrophosphate-binding protein [Symbiobacteriaceae bacterium]
MSFNHAGKLVARALKHEGTEVVFTLCGGHVMSIYDGCLDEGIRVVDVRHEATAAFAADGWSRLTGRPGVAIVTAGPGVTNAVTGVANAWRAQSPAVIIGGQGPHGLAGKGALQEMDGLSLMKPITKWQAQITDPKRIPEVLSTAFRQAISGVPGPVYVEIPVDVLFENAEPDEVTWPKPYAGRPDHPGDPSRIRAAAALLCQAKRPVVLLGSQIRWSGRWDGLDGCPSTLGAPVYVSGMARGLFRTAWGRSRKAALAEADLVIICGTPLDFRLNYGQSPVWNESCKVVHIDLDPAEPGRNRDADVAIVGDGRSVLTALMAAGDLGADQPERREWIERLADIEARQRAKTVAEARSDRYPTDPLRLCAEVDASLPENATVIGDGGDFVATAASLIRVRRYPAGWLDPGPLGTLGVGMGFAMAARLARPDSPVLLLLGDGTAGLNLMEVEAAVRQQIPFVVVIGNDGGWTQIRRGQVQMFGEDRAPATGLAYTRYDLAAAGLGAHAEYVEQPAEIRPALERAFAAGKVAVVNVRIGASDFRAGAISI